MQLMFFPMAVGVRVDVIATFDDDCFEFLKIQIIIIKNEELIKMNEKARIVESVVDCVVGK